MARALGAAALQEEIVGRIRALGPAGLRRLRQDVIELSRQSELTYTQEDGTTEIMPILLAPSVLARSDQAYLHRISRVLMGAFERTVAARRSDPLVREVLPLDPAEEEWLRLGPPRPGPVIGRFDVNIDPARGGAGGAMLLELNGCAVGGIHYGPATTDTVLTQLAAIGGARGLRPSPAMSDVWLEMCRAHARRLGRRGLSLVWLEDREWEAGITEGPTLADRLTRMGHPASVCDPRQLSFRRDELHLGSRRVDIVYRGIELRDILLIEEESGPLHALREAVRRGQVLSPMEGDLDHKSLLEVWSSPRFARRFSAAERAVFRRHVPWTRLLGERFTDGPDGRRVDLPAHAGRHRARLVLKPNRACGGEGVLIGRDTPATSWERAIAAALRGEVPAVVQTWIPGATLRSPVLRGGRVVLERFYTNYGLLAGARRLGILGRAAPFPVVNVSRGGGVLGVLFA